MADYVDYGVGQGVRLTKKGKGLWCKMDDGETVCVPLSQISSRSEINDTGDLGHLIVSAWWAALPRLRMPNAPVVDPDHRLILISDQTKQEIMLRKAKEA